MITVSPEQMRDLVSFLGYNTAKVRYIEFVDKRGMEIRPLLLDIGRVTHFLEGIKQKQPNCEVGVRYWTSIDSYVQRKRAFYHGIIERAEQIQEHRLDPYDWQKALNPTVIRFTECYLIPN